jgi:hypothetical protein
MPHGYSTYQHKTVKNHVFLYWGVIKHGVPQGLILSFLST